MPKVTLSAAVVAEAICPPGRSKFELWDQTVSGFTLECRPSGGKTYYLRYFDASGRQRQFKIGRAEDVTFAAAKKKAQQLRSEVVLGGDPSAKKAEAKAVPLFSEIAQQHLAYAKLHLKSFDDVESCYRVHISPKWSKMRVNEITRGAVAQWLADKRAAGLSAASVDKLRILMGRAYSLASQEDIPGCERNPTRLPRKPLNNERQRFLSQEEVGRLMAAAAASRNPQLQHIVGLLLQTGARKREILTAKWDAVDLDRRQLFIPTSKTGRSRYVPLSTPAVEIIGKLPRFSGCPYLVPNPKTLKPFTTLKTGWAEAIKVAKLPGLRIHDLRHSCASFLVSAGVDLYAVGKVLGHANVASSARYSHLSQQALLDAVERGAAKQIA